MSLENRFINSLKYGCELSEDKVEVITFGYRLFIYSVLGYLAIALLAYFLGTLPATLTAAITASLFRVFSGGAHASSQNRCVVIGAVIFNLLGLATTIYYEIISLYSLKWFAYITALVALISFILYAPADTPGKPITTKVQRNKLKSISIVLLFIWTILIYFGFKREMSTYKLYFLASVLGLAWQSASLLPIAYKLSIF